MTHLPTARTTETGSGTGQGARARTPQVGQRIETWFSGEADGRSTVLAVRPYTGRYPEFFRYIVRVSAPRTRRGWMELCA